MTLELTDAEVKLLIDSLRFNERASRIGLARSAEKLVEKGLFTELADKATRAVAVFDAFRDLRARLGDVTPVKVDINDKLATTKTEAQI